MYILIYSMVCYNFLRFCSFFLIFLILLFRLNNFKWLSSNRLIRYFAYLSILLNPYKKILKRLLFFSSIVSVVIVIISICVNIPILFIYYFLISFNYLFVFPFCSLSMLMALSRKFAVWVSTEMISGDLFCSFQWVIFSFFFFFVCLVIFCWKLNIWKKKNNQSLLLVFGFLFIFSPSKKTSN